MTDIRDDLLAAVEKWRAEVSRLTAALAESERSLVGARAMADDFKRRADEHATLQAAAERREAEARGELATILAERDAAVSMGTQLERDRAAARQALAESEAAHRRCADGHHEIEETLRTKFEAQEQKMIAEELAHEDTQDALRACERRLREAERATGYLNACLDNISGALCDASDIPVPTASRYHEAVRSLVAQRDALRAERDGVRTTLNLVRELVAEMHADATRPRGGQSVSPRRMPVALSVVLELERALGPEQAAYTREGYAALRSRCEALEAGLGALVARLAEVHADDSYQTVWIIAQWHRGPYTGPTYKAELAAARALLRSPTGGTKTSNEG